VPRYVARAVGLDPLNPAVLSAAGAGLLMARFDADAAALFEHALDLAPEFSNAQAWLGRCRFLAGDHDGAETLLRRAAGAGLAVASALLAEVLVSAGKIEEAIAVREAIERAATDRYVQWLVRAMAAAVVGDSDAARAHFAAAIADHEPGVLMGRALRSPALQKLIEPLLAAHDVLRDRGDGQPNGKGC
jgi:tetratricopeptide (TPR) repeat protein